MSNKPLPQAAVAIAAALLSTTVWAAQSAANPPAGNSDVAVAKPSPYQGVSTPPASDVITTSDEEAAPPPAARIQPAPAPKPSALAAAKPAAESDPDSALMVTSVAADSEDDSPALRARPAKAADNPDAQIVTYVPGPANALPEGTVFQARMLQEIMADGTAPGTPFRAKLTQNLMHDGRIVVPRGSELRGKVVHTSYGRRIGGRSEIHLRPEEFILPDGTHYHLHAQVIDTFGSDTQAIGEGSIAPESHAKRTLVEVAAASGGGALIGANFGGPAGAAVGSAVGAGLMGAHWLMATHAVDLPENSTVVFSLTDPMFLTPTRN